MKGSSLPPLLIATYSIYTHLLRVTFEQLIQAVEHGINDDYTDEQLNDILEQFIQLLEEKVTAYI